MIKKVFAIDISDPSIFPPARFGNLGALLNIIFTLIMSGSAIIFLVVLISGAYNILTAGDNPEKIKKAQQTFLYSVIGLVVIAGAYLFVKIIARIFRVPTYF